MKRITTVLAVVFLLVSCTSSATPEPVPILSPRDQIAYKTPEHLRSTGSDACAPVPEVGVATLECIFVTANADAPMGGKQLTDAGDAP